MRARIQWQPKIAGPDRRAHQRSSPDVKMSVNPTTMNTKTATDQRSQLFPLWMEHLLALMTFFSIGFLLVNGRAYLEEGTWRNFGYFWNYLREGGAPLNEQFIWISVTMVTGMVIFRFIGLRPRLNSSFLRRLIWSMIVLPVGVVFMAALFFLVYAFATAL